MFLEKIFGKVSREKPRRIYVIFDNEKREYVFIDGKYIPRDKILYVDTVNNKVVYIDYDGRIKVASISSESAGAKQIQQRVEKTVYV